MSKVNLKQFSDRVIALQGFPPGFQIVLKGRRTVRSDVGVNVPLPTKKTMPFLDDSLKVSDLIEAVENLLIDGLVLDSTVRLARLKVPYPGQTLLKRVRAEEPAVTVKMTGEADTRKLAKEFRSYLVKAERGFKPKDLASRAVLETCMEVLIARYTQKSVSGALDRV